jgi:hypothetical protein
VSSSLLLSWHAASALSLSLSVSLSLLQLPKLLEGRTWGWAISEAPLSRGGYALDGYFWGWAQGHF